MWVECPTLFELVLYPRDGTSFTYMIEVLDQAGIISDMPLDP